jgi:hypothetical protein
VNVITNRSRYYEMRGGSVNKRIQFITHLGKQILFIDLAHCPAREVEQVLREVPEVVTTRPRGSVLILSDFTAAMWDLDALRVMKESAVFDKPFVRKSAWVGAEGFSKEFSEALTIYSSREFRAFESREEALAWLAK